MLHSPSEDLGSGCVDEAGRRFLSEERQCGVEVGRNMLAPEFAPDFAGERLLRQFRPAPICDNGNVCIVRRGEAEGGHQEQLPRGVVEQVGAPNDVCDADGRVVDDNGELVGVETIAASDDEIAGGLFELFRLGPENAVVEADAGAQSETARRTAQEVIDAAPDDAWRELDPDNTLYFGVAGERVVVELAPEFAPAHVENIKALVRGGYLDGGAINRAQDNYVVQWGTRPLADGESFPDDIARSLPAEFEVAAAELPFTPIVDGDVYAPEAGFVRGFPAGRDPASGVTWMAHCYGVVGVARGNDPDSGSGSALYVVIGHSPRHLDRNLSMVGRVVSGMEHLSTLPRGTSALGRYASREEWVPLEEARLGSDMSPEERAPLEIMRTESQSFGDFVVASRSRHEDFFVFPTNRVGLCNVRVPVR